MPPGPPPGAGGPASDTGSRASPVGRDEWGGDRWAVQGPVWSCEWACQAGGDACKTLSWRWAGLLLLQARHRYRGGGGTIGRAAGLSGEIWGAGLRAQKAFQELGSPVAQTLRWEPRGLGHATGHVGWAGSRNRSWRRALARREWATAEAAAVATIFDQAVA